MSTKVECGGLEGFFAEDELREMAMQLPGDHLELIRIEGEDPRMVVKVIPMKLYVYAFVGMMCDAIHDFFSWCNELIGDFDFVSIALTSHVA